MNVVRESAARADVARDPVRFRRLGAIVFVPLVIACQYDPHAHLYTTVKPAPSEVVGVYRLASETLLKSDLSGLRGRLSLLRLDADGTFEATNLPRWDLHTPGTDFFDRLVSGSGSWRIGSVGAVDDGWNSKTVWGVYLDSSGAELAPAHLTGLRSPHGLLFSIGDPDAGEALIFSREQ